MENVEDSNSTPGPSSKLQVFFNGRDGRSQGKRAYGKRAGLVRQRSYRKKVVADDD